jgi:rubrerythrin
VARKIPKSDDPKKHWLCEDCGHGVVGESPPDECPRCANKFFDNLHDRLMESGPQLGFAA